MGVDARRHGAGGTAQNTTGRRGFFPMQRGAPMNCFPTHDHDLENRPIDPARYARVLEAASGHGMTQVSIDTPHSEPDPAHERWSVEDAATYWFPAWQPRERGKPHLSADAITGLVATAFLRHYAGLPLLEKFFRSLHSGVHPTSRPATTTNPQETIPASLFCRAAHVAFRPGVIKLDEKHSSTGLRAVASKTLRPCSQECCRETETILGGCISRESFENALNSGIFLPVRAMNASPITLLLSRLACWEKSPPTIAVSAGEAHTKALYAPYWVHDAINNMARLIPGLLARPEIRAEIRAGVEVLMPRYFTLRKEYKLAERDGTVPARTTASRDEQVANVIWQSSGAEPISFRRSWNPTHLPPRRR
jgi:hypothetical protein